MKQLFFLVAALGLVLSTFAQNTGRIEGLVADTSGTGLKGVSIDILDKSGARTGRDIATRTDGSYAMINLAAGRYNLQYSYSGYCIVVVHGIIVTSDHDTEVNLHLHHCSGREYEAVEYKRPFQNRMPKYFK